MTHTEAVNSLASERYLLEEMSEPEREAFEAHYFECAECAGDVTIGARMQDGVGAGLVQSPHVARVATFTPAQKPGAAAVTAPAAMRAQTRAWYQSALVPWAVAATLAVMVGYQARQTPGPTASTDRTAAVTPTLLRPASRGAVPTVSIGAPYAALALDVDVAGATALAYELRDGAGAVLASGRTSVPAAGAPLLIVIPSFTLKGEQQYSLTVRDAAQAERTLGDYRFSTTR